MRPLCPKKRYDPSKDPMYYALLIIVAVITWMILDMVGL